VGRVKHFAALLCASINSILLEAPLPLLPNHIPLDLPLAFSLFSLHGITYSPLVLSRSTALHAPLKLHGLAGLCGEKLWYSMTLAPTLRNLTLSLSAALLGCGLPSTVFAGSVIEMVSVARHKDDFPFRILITSAKLTVLEMPASTAETSVPGRRTGPRTHSSGSNPQTSRPRP
jgi:hypothetical protein